MLVPFENIEKFMIDRDIAIFGKDGKLKPWHRNVMLNLTDLEILNTYNSQIRGICNYYSLASNFNKLNYFTYLMEYSCLRTLARKHKTRSVAKIIKKYKQKNIWAIPYKTKSSNKTARIVKLKDIKRNQSVKLSDVDKIKHFVYYNITTTLKSRLNACKCELCGTKDSTKYEIHHVNKVKNLKGKSQWEKIMISRRRKTLLFCQECHKSIHKTQSK